MYWAEISVQEFCEDGEKHSLERHDMVRRVDRQGEYFDLVPKMLGLRTTENGTKIDELLQAGASGHKRAWQHVETNSGSERRVSPWKRGTGQSKEKRRDCKKGKYRSLWNEFETRGFMAQKGLWNRNDVAVRRCSAQGRRKLFVKVQGHA